MKIKSKILSQFEKVSKEELLVKTIEEVYSVVFYDKKSAPLAAFSSYPVFNEQLSDYLSEHMKHFYDETTVISEDGFNLMTYFEFILNAFDERNMYWCSYPQISYDIIEEADTYFSL